MEFIGGRQGGSKAGESLGSDKKQNGEAHTSFTWQVLQSKHSTGRWNSGNKITARVRSLPPALVPGAVP